jgi:hypothetical protein
MRHVAAAVLMFVAPAALAADSPPVLAPVADETLVNLFGGRVESRLDADFNGDGKVDAAAVMRDDEHEARSLQVLIGYADDYSFGHDPIDGVAMDPYPLGDASLSFRKGVLIVDDLTGGTTAIASTYRYRYDPEEHRMRLIGDDVSHYSRTNAHDALEISTNRLTGLRIRQVMKRLEETAEDDAAYDPQPEVRETVPTTPIYMAESPSPEFTLGLAD